MERMVPHVMVGCVGASVGAYACDGDDDGFDNDLFEHVAAVDRWNMIHVLARP